VSRYVSFTRLAAAGALVTGSEPRRVTGTSWMDHEWGSGSIGKDAAGWDWFAVQLDDGRDLMLYRMRSTDGAASPYTSGTLVSRDGKAESLSPKDIVIEETARWTSPKTKAEYPARWTLRVARAGLAVDVVPAIADQELVTAGSTRVTYWEGACTVRDLSRKLGRAYVELTGYAGVGGLGFFR
jgi:predicted secreted hydrolase